MSYYIIWFMDEGISKKGEVGEYENYAIVQFENIDVAWKEAEKMFGDKVISVEPYNP